LWIGQHQVGRQTTTAMTRPDCADVKTPKKAKTKTPTAGSDELNEYQAASLVGMSPALIRWLGSYAPKQGVPRKLKLRKEGDAVFVDRSELTDFNDWLRLPWPSKDSARPPIPTGIRDEIREEAGGDCAICHANAGSCEAAHIVPVAHSKNNHPENLIWLCSTHHTKFDKNAYGPSPDCADFVVSFKHTLAFYRRTVWDLQAKVTGRLYSVLKACESLESQLAAASTPEQVSAVEKLAKSTLGQVSKLAPKSKSDPDFAAFEAMKPQFAMLTKSSTKSKDLSRTLRLAVTVKADFALRAGYERCPLCSGNGHHKNEDCPACGGEGELTPAEIRATDFGRFADVDCPLCEGSGTFKQEDCPACRGEQRMERRFADQVDTREWDDVNCPICNGSGAHKGEDCPACGGSGEMERHQRDQIDERDYVNVDCPLCEGDGTHEGEDCPECGGDGQMERRFADEVDVRSYKTMECFICDGSGEYFDLQCNACGGRGEFPRWHADRIDRGDYKVVKCPTCRGRDRERRDCRSCDGRGELPRYIADQIDPN